MPVGKTEQEGRAGKGGADTEAAVSPSVYLCRQAAGELLLLLPHHSQFQHEQKSVQDKADPPSPRACLSVAWCTKAPRWRIISKCHQRNGRKGKPGERTKATDMQKRARRLSANVTFSHGLGEISSGGKERGEPHRFASEAAQTLGCV